MLHRGKIIAALLVALGGCGAGSGSSSPAPTPLEPTLASIQANIFTPTCAVSGCHSGPGAIQQLRLDDGFSYANLVGVASTQDATLTRVIAGDADKSFLIQKLEGTQTVGGRMPLNGPYFQQVTIDVIRQWIDNGAQP